MTWKIELTNGAVLFTDDCIDLARLRSDRWLRVYALARAVSGNLLRDRPGRVTYVNTRRILIITEVDP